MPGRDIVVIGSSAGGVEVLLDLASTLPTDYAGAVFVVQHIAPDQPSLLPELLSSRGRLPALHPHHGDAIAPGRIYVAPPDTHLLVRRGRVEVVRGPKENGHRPAVDPLFRSAARAYGPRVVGVVLSGYLDCGTAGMLTVKARGGVTVVQDPATASAPDMPRSVIAHAPVDHLIAPRALAGLLVQLAAGRPPSTAAEAPSAQVEPLEHGGGERAEVVCPHCHGVLTETEAGGFQRFRCHVGHAFSLASLAEEQGEELERALWSAVRSLEESAGLSARLARAGGSAELRRRFAEKEGRLRRQAGAVRGLLLRGDPRILEPPAAQPGASQEEDEPAPA